MRYLLDTHCWLWLQAAPERIGRRTTKRLEDPRNELLLSTASAWEIAIKYELGKLRLPSAPSEYVPSRLEVSGTRLFELELRHVLHVADLPRHHRDPFDRLLVAQAQLDDLVLVTDDDGILAYDVKVLEP